MISEMHTIFTLGKGPISSYNNQARVWVADMTAKMKAILILPKRLIRSGVLDEIQLFSTYSDVDVLVKSSNRLIAVEKKDFQRGEPSCLSPSQIFQKLKIPVVKMSEFENSNKYSATNSKGYYLAYDIRCIKNCFITKRFKMHKEVDGWKYQLGCISVTVHSTDGSTTNEELNIPSKLDCWVHPEFAHPVDTFGDAYGVLKQNKKYEIAFDLCYFDDLHLGEEVEKESKSHTQNFG